jgi:hypothetical protein
MAGAPVITAAAVDRLLELVAGGRGADAADLYVAEALLDATTPGWRFQKHGGPAISAVWSGWFAEPGTLEELERLPTPDGEVVSYLVKGTEEDGRTFAARHCHVLTVDPGSGLIARHKVWCGGRWYADRLAEMAEAQRADDAG